MTNADREALRAQLLEHEGIRLKPYKDSVGILTIGVGRNLEDVGISRDEALLLLDNDIWAHLNALVADYPWFEELDGIRQRALVDLHFNLGATRFAGFRRFLAAMERGDYAQAGAELVDSRWYQQVGRRGPRIVRMVSTGQEP